MKKIFLSLLTITLLSVISFNAAARINEYNYPKYALKAMEPGGYKGIVEVGGGFAYSDDLLYICKLTTTHGYQFNSYIYAGFMAGLGNVAVTHTTTDYKDAVYTYTDTEMSAVFAADTRFYICPDKELKPFMGLQVGTELISGMKMYFAASIGVRLDLNNALGVNVSLSTGLKEVMLKVGFEF